MPHMELFLDMKARWRPAWGLPQSVIEWDMVVSWEGTQGDSL